MSASFGGVVVDGRNNRYAPTEMKRNSTMTTTMNLTSPFVPMLCASSACCLPSHRYPSLLTLQLSTELSHPRRHVSANRGILLYDIVSDTRGCALKINGETIQVCRILCRQGPILGNACSNVLDAGNRSVRPLRAGQAHVGHESGRLDLLGINSIEYWILFVQRHHDCANICQRFKPSCNGPRQLTPCERCQVSGCGCQHECVPREPADFAPDNLHTIAVGGHDSAQELILRRLLISSRCTTCCYQDYGKQDAHERRNYRKGS